MRLLIKNGTIINANGQTEQKKDILIENGTIIRIGDGITDDFEQMIDAGGYHVLPGLIDAHCHLREPGFEYKEDIESGTASALHGGFTSVACMPNTNPVIDNEALIKYVYDRSRSLGGTKVYPIAAVSINQDGKMLTEMGLLKQAGAIAFSDDGKPVESAAFMKKALLYADTFDGLIISHCEDKTLCEDGVMNEGYMSTLLGLNGSPKAAEEIMVYRDVRLAEYTGTRIHIAHVSTRESVDIVRQAKKRGVKVTAETCPHYFTLTERSCDHFNTLAKVNPPLRTDDDVAAIIEGLKDGTIDIIATDHAPHHNDEKNVEFSYASNGMIGFETAFCLSYTYLVKPGHLTMSRLIEKMSLNPALLLSLEAGEIKEGKEADITIVDLNERKVIDINEFKSRSRNSPYHGFEVYGGIKNVIIEGKVVL